LPLISRSIIVSYVLQVANFCSNTVIF